MQYFQTRLQISDKEGKGEAISPLKRATGQQGARTAVITENH